MDTHPTPFPGKSQSGKSQYFRKTTDAPKPNAKEASTQRQNRVFGTTRNTNVVVPQKPATEKPLKTKPSQRVPIRQQPKPIIPPSACPTEVPKTEDFKKSPVRTKETKPKKKKSVCFQENVGENLVKKLQEGEGEIVAEPRTPARSPATMIKPTRVSGTPYKSAERCSNCRFDRLETSSYWLNQIKLSESVGKHFVSAAFFRLASESKAEPYRNLHVELKRYLARLNYLFSETQWKGVSRSYGLLKEESNAINVDSSPEKVVTGDATKGIREQEVTKEHNNEVKEAANEET